MREVFITVKYIVAWAGCNIPPMERTFLGWEEALKYYDSLEGKLSLRIEEYTTTTKIKIVWPEGGR